MSKLGSSDNPLKVAIVGAGPSGFYAADALINSDLKVEVNLIEKYTLNKYYGDTVDTWRQFETNLYEDINGVHGAITSSTFMFNQIYSFLFSRLALDGSI